MNGAGFWDVLVGLMEQEAVRGIMAGGLIVLLSIPKALIGEGLKAIPNTILPMERIPPVLALVGLVLGVLLGIYTPLPMDLSIAVGVGAGWGSGTTYDNRPRGPRGGSE